MNSSCSVMIVDDVEGDRVRTAHLLEAAGFSPPFALIDEGGAAQEVLTTRGHLFHVAFFDLRMPSLDGLQLLTWVRAQSHLSHLRVIIITGDDNPDEIQRLCAAGADGYFTKYPSAAKLAAILSNISPEIIRGPGVLAQSA